MTDANHVTPIRRTARIEGHSGLGTALRDALATLEREIRPQPGCVEFSFSQSVSDGSFFVMPEHFDSPSPTPGACSRQVWWFRCRPSTCRRSADSGSPPMA